MLKLTSCGPGPTPVYNKVFDCSKHRVSAVVNSQLLMDTLMFANITTFILFGSALSQHEDHCFHCFHCYLVCVKHI